MHNVVIGAILSFICSAWFATLELAEYVHFVLDDGVDDCSDEMAARLMYAHVPAIGL